jgi:putative DNA primase/helicase
MSPRYDDASAGGPRRRDTAGLEPQELRAHDTAPRRVIATADAEALPAARNQRLRCPACGRSDRDRTMGVTVMHDRTIWHCFRCGEAGARRHAQSAATSRRARPVPQPVPEHHTTLTPHWRAVWANLRPVRGTTAEQYLRARGCAIPSDDADIRYGELQHPSGHIGPCLLGLVTDALTREPLTLHRTWIRADGRKADVDPPRLLLSRHRKAGGVIRLWPESSAPKTGLAIAEGIETALAVATVYRPTWSCIDAGNLAALPVLDGVERLLIVADHDEAGIRGARACARRWHAAEREVRIAMPPEQGMDAADMVAL